MDKNLEEVSLQTLQQRLLEEIDAQMRLNEELKIALKRERDLKLENDLLWVYLQRKHPARVEDAQQLLSKLWAGSDLEIELDELSIAPNGQRSVTLNKRVRRKLGRLPGVQRIYHRIKNIIK